MLDNTSIRTTLKLTKDSMEKVNAICVSLGVSKKDAYTILAKAGVHVNVKRVHNEAIRKVCVISRLVWKLLRAGFDVNDLIENGYEIVKKDIKESAKLEGFFNAVRVLERDYSIGMITAEECAASLVRLVKDIK